MRKLVLSVFGFLLSVSTYAGIPSQDPVVAQIRTQIVKGHTPTIDDLISGARWKCLARSARKDSFQENFFYISFSAFDGLVMPTFYNGPGWNEEKRTDMNWSSMAFTTQGLIGNQPQHRRILLRIENSNQNLVIEQSTDPNLEELNNASYPSAILDSNLKALNYFICPQEQIDHN